MIINLMWPREEFYGTLWYQKYGPIVITILLVVIGLAIYYGGQKRQGRRARGAPGRRRRHGRLN